MVENKKARCHKCNLELVDDPEVCPLCGTALYPHGVSREIMLMNKVRTTYNMVFCAEYLDIDTREVNELIASTRDLMGTDDLDSAEELITKAMNSVCVPLEKALSKELSDIHRMLRKKEVFGRDVSRFKDLLRGANSALADKDYDTCLAIIDSIKKNF